LRLALGADNGTASINVPSGTNMASFLAPEDQAKAAWSFVTNAERTEVVSMKELDTVLDELGAKLDTKRLFLKLDTQGWDIEVMKGASRSLPRVCLIQCELSFKPIYAGQPSYIEALQYFKDRGFEIAGLFPLVRDRNWGVIEADCVLVRSLPGPQIRDD
jgi:FkbM family methyltransferase